jgi:hypothetical protein
MKLTPEQIDGVTSQFEAQAVPQDNRMIAELNNMFGEHTFFLDNNGLHIVEKLAEPEEAGAPIVRAPIVRAPIVRVVKLASWTDPDHRTLAAHPPEPTDLVINLDKAA